ncbi:MAG: ABC transporter permease [Hungatella sp.]|nr:ABC transporter permease [Hungatella sp.]
MKLFFVLLKVSIRSMLLSSTNSRGRSKKKAATGLGAVFIIAFLGLYLSGIYSYLLMKALAPSNMEVLVFIFMGMVALVGGLLFTTFAVKGVVFGGKDNDLLLSMPVPTTMLMASRVTAIYLENLLFSVFVLLPAGVICTFLTQSGVGHSLLFWIRLGIVVLSLPLLDTALSVLLGALVAFVSARLSRGALGQNLVMGIFLGAVFYFSFHLSGMLNGLAQNAAGLKNALTWAAPVLWMGEGIMGEWGLLLAFVLCCALPFALVVIGLGRVYRQAVTAFAVQSVQSNYRLSVQNASGQKKALLKKEMKRFFGTPMYFWNAGMGLIMLLAAGAASLIMRDKLLAYVEMAGYPMPLLPVAGAVIGFCLCTCPIAAPSISLEGKYLWILRESPIEESSLLWVKVGFQLLLTLPCTVIAGICFSVALGFELWQGAVLLIATLLFAIGQAFFGMLMGLCFPRLDAVNETVVIKQSMATVLAMFASMAILGAAAGLYYWGGRIIWWMALALPVGLFALFAAVCALILKKQGPSMLKRL